MDSSYELAGHNDVSTYGSKITYMWYVMGELELLFQRSTTFIHVCCQFTDCSLLLLLLRLPTLRLFLRGQTITVILIVRPMSHLRFYREILSRDFIAP